MEAAFRRYVEQCPDAVLVTDPDGTIVYEEALRKQADGAMYAAKAAGGNRYVFYRR